MVACYSSKVDAPVRVGSDAPASKVHMGEQLFRKQQVVRSIRARSSNGVYASGQTTRLGSEKT